MTRCGWHILREDGAVTLTRRLPVAFDLDARGTFPPARKTRLAHQIRQDLWRMLRHIRGFSPVVRVEDDGAGLTVTAGGRIAGPCAKAQAEMRIAALLSCPRTRARWLAHARPVEAR